MTREALARLMQGDELLEVDDVLDRPAWHDQAACIDSAVDFYPGRGASSEPAKAVCAGCAVRGECLEYALSHADRFGIWGGLSERERRRVRRAEGYEHQPIVRRCEVCHDVAAPRDPAARIVCHDCRIDENNRYRERVSTTVDESTSVDIAAA